ncbi:hypothetical protein PF005_g28380 [Phytophthora fragariae]|uniref:Uncharacterized protein n=1 Tax=Phytophthora fragariae TaxID=53985 RepID=A0A6A3VJB7_9STRA|nr:hypothetical protein PF005_g28380 [Phytophthora fragariae]KAE9272502.1 hypothetical protein PF001_g27913 [Phytophthora fragariae]
MMLEGVDMQQPTRTTTITKAVACVVVGAVVVSGNAGAAAADVAAVAAFWIDETSLGSEDRMCGVVLIGQENPAAE